MFRQAMKKSNFDRYLERQMQDPAFAARFERAGDAWDVALQIAAQRAASYRVKRAKTKRT
jgi:hypothetical protein